MMTFGRLLGGAGGRGRAPLNMHLMQILHLNPARPAPPAGVRRILRLPPLPPAPIHRQVTCELQTSGSNYMTTYYVLLSAMCLG